jgi:mannose-6-phosphate isomerase-like protein (cupin superfamily)
MSKTTRRPTAKPARQATVRTARKTAPKTVVKPARKPAAKSARKPGPPAKSKAAARPRKATVKRTRKPAQQFSVSHLREADFKSGGLRNYAHYRDLGIAAATRGLAQAHVIRMIPPCTPEVSKRHYHDVDFQLVYVLKGWMTTDFEGQGPITMRAGSCWLQPPRIAHTVLDYSSDCELLEIILPADFETVGIDAG